MPVKKVWNWSAQLYTDFLGQAGRYYAGPQW